MNGSDKRKGLAAGGGVLAAAAAALLLSGQVAPSVAADHEEELVKCHGVNGCKGQSECATDHSACNGENSCAGKGWIKMTQAECDEAKAKAAEGER